MKFRLILTLVVLRFTVFAPRADSHAVGRSRRLAHTTAVGGIDEITSWKPPNVLAESSDSALPAATSSISVPIVRIGHGVPYGIGPTVIPATSFPQAEEHIAADPSNAANLVAAVSDFAPIPGSPVFFNNTTKYAVSLDAGVSWSESYVPLANGLRITGDGRAWQANSDPVVAIDRVGNVFLAGLSFNRGDHANGIYVCTAPLPDVAMTAAGCNSVAVNSDPATPFLEDKEWIAVDNGSSSYSGNLYAAWTHYDFRSDPDFGTDWIQFSRSIDQGKTWSPPIRLSPASQDGVHLSGVQGPQVAVGPNGTVSVVYGWGGNQCGGSSTCQHFVATSTDGGLSFGEARAVTPVFSDLAFDASYRFNSFPAIAVSPVDGALCDVYADQPGPSSQIEMACSTGQNVTAFTPPVALNDSATGQRLMPAAAFDAKGILHVSWFDTRHAVSGNERYDVFAALVSNGGSTLSRNARLTTTSVETTGSWFIGDYSGIAASFDGTATFVHPVWTNGSLAEDRSVSQTSTGGLRTSTLSVRLGNPVGKPIRRRPHRVDEN